jgi:hypothetical protein
MLRFVSDSHRKRQTPPTHCRWLLSVSLASLLSGLSGCLPIPLGAAPPTPANPPDGPYREAVQALRGITGDWQGELVHRDDRTQSLETLPVRVSNALALDGVHMISHRETVTGGSVTRATDITWVDARAGTLLMAAFDARGHTDQRYTISSFEGADPFNWTIVADAPADTGGANDTVRITLTRGGNRLSWRQDVRQGAGKFAFRAQLTLDKEPP